MSEPQSNRPQDPAEGVDEERQPEGEQPPRVHPDQPAEGPDDGSAEQPTN
jgi:hypothetical protein